jgi:Cathepsin propeptide inhibitor domain (I29)
MRLRMKRRKGQNAETRKQENEIRFNFVFIINSDIVMGFFLNSALLLSLLASVSFQFSTRLEANARLEQPEPLSQEEMNGLFAFFKQHFQRKYNGPSEDRFRRSVFEEKLKSIQEHNRQGLSWKMGITGFADMTQEEFEESVLMDSQDCSATSPHPNANTNAKRRGKTLEGNSITEPPFYVDWRNLGVVSEVKNQGTLSFHLKHFDIFRPLRILLDIR